MNIDIIDIDTIDATQCRIDGFVFDKANCVVSAYGTEHAQIVADGETFIASLGSAINGWRPSTQAALIYSIRSAVREAPFDYYVDSVGGADENAGTIAAPFKTLAAVEAVLSDGVSVGLKCGSHWREELNLGSFRHIQIMAYGEGEKPLLDASEIIASGSWTKSGGLTNVYQQTLALDTVASGFLSVWEDSARLVKVTSTALCDSTAGSMYASTENGTSTTIYIHATASGNPTSNGKVYEYSARNYGLGGRGADHLTVRGIATRRNANIGGSLWTGRNARIIDCVASDGSNHCIQYKDGSYLKDVVAEDCYYTLDQPTHFVCYEDAPIGLGVRHVSCIARQNGTQPTAYGFYGHRSSGGSFGTITYDNCQVTNISYGWGGSAGAYVINNPTCSGTLTIPIFLTGGESVALTGGTYSGLKNLVRITGGDDQRITLTNVTATSGNSTVSFAAGVDRTVLRMTGCNLTEASTDAGSTAVIILQGASQTIISRGNTLTAASNHYPYYTNEATTLDSNGNTFKAGNRFRIGGVTYNDFAAYRAAFPRQDINSVSA